MSDFDTSPTLPSEARGGPGSPNGRLDFSATVVGLRLDQRVFGRYQLRRLLGRGGMGVVWLAFDERLQSEVALKFLPEAFLADTRSVEDFQRETRRALELTHHHIVRIFTFEQDAQAAAITMEWVDGPSLSRLAAGKAEGVFEAQELKEWLRQLCEALEYAHGKAKTVHRDLKPANLMINSKGELKVADFGISATLADTVTRLTQASHASSGTPMYMSPQQMMGEVPVVTDDIYSIGALLYELLTGRPPFYTGDIALQVQTKVAPSMAKRRQELGVSGARIPEDWERLVADCLEKDPTKRPQSARALAQRLGLALSTSGPAEGGASVKVEKRISRSLTGVSRRWGFWALCGLVVLASLWVFGFYLPAKQRLAEEQARQETLRQEQKLQEEQQRLEAEKREAERIAALRGGVVVVTEPVGAEVLVGSFAVEKSPATLKEVKLGTHAVLVRKAGYEDWNGEVQVRENRFSELKVKLTRSTGTLRVESEPNGLEIELVSTQEGGGLVEKRSAKAPLVLSGLPTGSYTLLGHRPGFADLVQTVEVRRGEENKAQLDMSGGDLVLQSVPSGAEVFTSGKPERSLGKTPLSLSELPPGVLALRLVLPRHRDYVTQVQIQKKGRAELAVELVPLSFNIPGLNLSFLPVSSGRFLLGSPESAVGRERNEGPQTELVMSKAFWVSETEVTHGQWKALMATDLAAQVKKMLSETTKSAAPVAGKNASDQDFWKGSRVELSESYLGDTGDEVAMHYVSWSEAKEFCRRLTERERSAGRLPEGFRYDLPNEAQWEYACRAGTTSATYAGPLLILGKHAAPVLEEIAWYGGNSSVGYRNRGQDTAAWKEKTSPAGTAWVREVGRKKPNAWGLHDMLGNVAEWTDSWYGLLPGGKQDDYRGPATGTYRVVRGGSWATDAAHCQASSRSGEEAALRRRDLGFRVALVGEGKRAERLKD